MCIKWCVCFFLKKSGYYTCLLLKIGMWPTNAFRKSNSKHIISNGKIEFLTLLLSYIYDLTKQLP